MSKKKIMVVDDEPDILEYLMAALEDNGYITCTVDDINDILTSINLEKPDLIILDIMMPDRSGLSIYKEIQLSSEYKTIPIIFISGLSSKKDFMAELFNDKQDVGKFTSPDLFIEKPLQLDQLKEQISRLL
ncbi:MAG: response regulator [Desulfobacula sp.]|nr:response regulator [Desulfobacula sp.]